MSAPPAPPAPAPTAAPPVPSRRPPWLLPLLVLLAVLVVGAPVALLSRAGAVTTGADRIPGLPVAPRPSAPGAAPLPLAPSVPDPNGGAVPTPDPSTGLLHTPPALAALGYRAATLSRVTPEAVASDPGEVGEFARDGLQSITRMELLGIDRPGGAYLASVYVVRFRDHAGAARELAYSTNANRKLGLTPIPVLGLAGATGLLDSRSGSPEGQDFIVVGTKQLFAAVSPLASSPTAAQVGAETAVVLKALVADADLIRPPAASASPAPAVPSPGQPGTPSDPVPAPQLPTTPQDPALPAPTTSAQPA